MVGIVKQGYLGGQMYLWVCYWPKAESTKLPVKLGKDTEREVGCSWWECQWFTVGPFRGAVLVEPALHFLLLQYSGGGEVKRTGRQESFWKSSSVHGHTSCFIQFSKLGLSKPSWWTLFGEPRPCQPPHYPPVRDTSSIFYLLDEW